MSGSGLSFAAFVLSLAHTAAVHFGDIRDPVSGHAAERNLPAAQQMIDVLALLEEKTRGNLTAEERQRLERGFAAAMAKIRAGEVEVTAGGVGGILAAEAELEQSAATVVVAREAEMEQAAGGIVVAGRVQATQSAIGLLVTPRFEGSGNRVLFGPAAAFAFGAGFATVLWLLRRR